LGSQGVPIVFTSATLRVSGSYDFIKSQLGIQDAEVVSLPPVFNYPAQMRILVADINPRNEEDIYITELSEIISQCVVRSRGRALILFTSYATMHKVAEKIESEIGRNGLDLIVAEKYQSKTALLEWFRTTPNCILMGTHSYWEGVDVPGDALSLIIITRIPFEVPYTTLSVAREKYYKEHDRDFFKEYSLPNAIMLLKQGIGRLIRIESDKGVVVICDNRIIKSSYGREIRSNLPATPQQGDMHQILNIISNFIG